MSTASAFGFRVVRPGTGETTQTTQERPFNRRLLFFECLLDPAILEELTARCQEVGREQQDRLGGSTDFWPLVVRKAFRPLPKLHNLLVVNHEEPSSSLPKQDNVRIERAC